MPSPFDQDDQPTTPTTPSAGWPTRPDWPAQAGATTPPAPPAHPRADVHPAPATRPATGSPAWSAPSATPPVWQARPVGPPTGPPPVPPGSWPAPTPVPPGPRPSGSTSRTSRVGLAVVLVVALLVGATAGGVASRAIFTSSPSATDTASAPLAPTQGSSTPTTTAPDQGTGGSGSTSGSSGEMASWGEVVDAVTAGVVNIESRVSGGIGAGTGMVLTSDGEVLTNNHVVEGASAIVVTVVTTGESYRASIIGTDPEEDVAVLQLQGASGLETMPIGDSDEVRIGDQVAAIGNAGGDGGEPTVATGRITALEQQITASDEDGTNVQTLAGMIQVDAEVVPGDSGGPLASTSGEVVGMNTAAAVSGIGGSPRFRGGSGGGTGEGYAIPINDALDIAEALKESGDGASSADGAVGSGSGGFLGVQVTDGLDGGAEIVAVGAGSPADDSGLVAGDTIVALDRTEVASSDDLVAALSELDAGDEVTVTFVDPDGAARQTDVVLISR